MVVATTAVIDIVVDFVAAAVAVYQHFCNTKLCLPVSVCDTEKEHRYIYHQLSICNVNGVWREQGSVRVESEVIKVY